MKRFTLISIMMCLTVALFARVDNYKVNDAAVDALFENAIEISSPVMNDAQTLDFSASALSVKAKDVNPVVAWLLTYTSAVGVCGVHRLYLGTEFIVFVGYFCTVGGCGIIQTVDWVVLLIGLINDDISKYIDNPKFFMW